MMAAWGWRTVQVSATTDSDNIEILRRGYGALARRDFDVVFEIVDPEIVIRDRPEAPDPGVYRGYEGVLAAFDVSAEMFEQLEFLPERFVAEGDHVAVAVRLIGRGRESGVPVEDQVTHLWQMRAGKAVSLQVYSEMADALEAIGLQT
jgi:ketosteroid isomerase-like protein